jgi:hypothetical protein
MMSTYKLLYKDQHFDPSQEKITTGMRRALLLRNACSTCTCLTHRIYPIEYYGDETVSFSEHAVKDREHSCKTVLTPVQTP